MPKEVCNKKHTPKTVKVEEPEDDPEDQNVEEEEEEIPEDEDNDEDFDGEIEFDEEYNEDLSAIASALVSEDGETIADIMASIRDQLHNLVKIGKLMVKSR